MKARHSVPGLAVFGSTALVLTACLLPGMIPLTPVPEAPMPVMEKDADALIEVLKGSKWVYLQELAEEQYTREEYDRPGTLTFTVKITDDKPTYFNYGWCTTTEEILQQNFEYIRVRLYFNGDELGNDVVHPVTYTRPDGLVCLDFGVLMSDWPAGEYELKAVATFDQKINDGLADYEAGDYVFSYKVTVEK
ncbi:MAG TPA: hypothetical protein VI524_04985 [Anaerolineales bacterium]|nr:hypothetical protein [Anaerolineales bacterium]